MPLAERLTIKIKDFLIDYCQRHAQPTNAVLHIFGVPMAFFGLFKVCTGRFAFGSLLLFVGYLFQYLGHKAQGNEVGEVTLLKSVWRKLNRPKLNHHKDHISGGS